MAMRARSILIAILALLPAACIAGPTPSSFCAVVDIQQWDTSSLIQQMDGYAAAHTLKRGTPSPAGLLYASQDRSFLINVQVVRSGWAEVAFFPKVAGTAGEEADALEEFVLGRLGSGFRVTRCGSIPDYKGGVLYGYDRVAIQ